MDKLLIGDVVQLMLCPNNIGTVIAVKDNPLGADKLYQIVWQLTNQQSLYFREALVRVYSIEDKEKKIVN
jgi:hypothetical protein